MDGSSGYNTRFSPQVGCLRTLSTTVAVTGGDQTLTATTDRHGTASFSGLAPGTYQVSAGRPLYGTGQITVTVHPTGTEAGLSIRSGDVTGDGRIDRLDLEVLTAAWATESPDRCRMVPSTAAASAGRHATSRHSRMRGCP